MSRPRARNVSFAGVAPEIELISPRVVFIDPLYLDQVSGKLRAPGRAGGKDVGTELEGFVKRHGWPGVLACVQVPSFRPGRYAFDVASIRSSAAEAGESPPLSVFDVDSGAVVLADASRLADVGRLLTWETYDTFLQAKEGDDRILLQVSRDAGSDCFAIVQSPGVDSGFEFEGDGAYRVARGAFRRLADV